MLAEKTAARRRRHRDVNLYFEGYERQVRLDPKTGRRKTDYVYVGDYYLFRLSQKGYDRFRLLSGLFVLGATALYVGANLLGPQGGKTLYVGIPALAAMIPMLYLLLGLFGLFGAKSPKMTIREYTFGLGRMKLSAWAVALLWGASLAGEGGYLLRYQVFTPGELAATGLQLLGIGLLVSQLKLQEQVLSTCIHAAASRYEGMDGTETVEGEKEHGCCR